MSNLLTRPRDLSVVHMPYIDGVRLRDIANQELHGIKDPLSYVFNLDLKHREFYPFTGARLVYHEYDGNVIYHLVAIIEKAFFTYFFGDHVGAQPLPPVPRYGFTLVIEYTGSNASDFLRYLTNKRSSDPPVQNKLTCALHAAVPPINSPYWSYLTKWKKHTHPNPTPPPTCPSPGYAVPTSVNLSVTPSPTIGSVTVT